jgi:predicted Rdx family selenoprotein
MFSIVHTDGSGDDNPPLASLSDLYDELLSTDREHGDVAVIHDSGWSMSAHRDGRLVFEHLRNGGERHMLPVLKERVLELWRRLVAGDIEGILSEPWKPGYLER